MGRRSARHTHRPRLVGALVAVATLGLAAPRVVAQPAAAPSSQASEPGALHGYSSYERETIADILSRRGGIIDPSPEGKRIESLEVVPLDVLEARDPPGRLWAPLTGFLNWFHVTTKPHVVEREALLGVGDRYEQRLVDETAKNLRSLRQLSLVVALPLRGSRPDRVKLLLITKDVWSLRLNTNFRIAGGKLQYFLLQPSEENLLGSHQSVAGQLLLEGEAYSLGATYTIPRIDDSRRGLLVSGNVIINRASGDPEGSFGSLVYEQPLYSTLAEWSWSLSLGWRKEITRRYINGEQAAFVAASAPDVDPLPARYRIPYRFKSDLLSTSYSVTRSFGRLDKNDLELGFEIDRRIFATEDLSAYDPASAQAFRQTIPVTDNRANPYLAYYAYSTRIAQTLDYDTLGLQEDVTRGHVIVLKLYPVSQALGSTRNLMGIQASALYTLPILDGELSGYLQSITEIQSDRLPDASVEGGIHFGTPSFKIGRVVMDARVLDRYRNYLNRQTTLGGERRLRGYPTGAFFGEDAAVANVEFRTRPLEIWTVQLGAAAFYDIGDAFDGWKDFRPKQSAGAGLRLLFPQLDRAVTRIDWGFPFTRPTRNDPFQDPYADGFPGDIIVTFSQAFGEPSVPSRFGSQ